LRV
ncbi:polymorphic outer membrane domain protein, partial [Chlamydia psittaci 84-8471/1]|jgi:hypothetical protein